jgi:hypothetical protein
MPPVSLILAAILPSGVLLTPVAKLPPVMHIDLRISPQIFENIRNDPNFIFRDFGEGDS